jgi:hypothetical protein
MTKQEELPKFVRTGIVFGIHGFRGKRAHLVVNADSMTSLCGLQGQKAVVL